MRWPSSRRVPRLEGYDVRAVASRAGGVSERAGKPHRRGWGAARQPDALRALPAATDRDWGRGGDRAAAGDPAGRRGRATTRSRSEVRS